ncbi:MAG: hypothetical protein GXC73_12525 [Chitinophagaceae bacterium]|nr:hypothetical protein [Chitinophagaceae bacterium]
MRDDKSIQDEIYTKLYKRDVDYSLNIFLCGADTTKKDTIRDLLNTEFKKDAKFNAVYPEFIFSSLYGKGGSNLLELEDELANYVDVIILPLEGIGTFCELGAFAVNKSLLPKIIAINNLKYKSNKSFINLGPIDLIKSNNPNNLIFYTEKREKEIVNKVVERVRLKKYEKRLSYDLENIFNLSRYILYLIAIFQPVSKDEIAKLIKLFDKGAVKTKYIDSALQILTQKNRIELDIDTKMENIFSLSEDGHKYVYEELITKLKVKKDFTTIRSIIINDRHKLKKRYLSKDKELLV